MVLKLATADQIEMLLKDTKDKESTFGERLIILTANFPNLLEQQPLPKLAEMIYLGKEPSPLTRALANQLSDQRPAIVHATTLLLHKIVVLCEPYLGEISLVRDRFKMWREFIIPKLLDVAAGGHTESRLKLVSGDIYSVRDGALVMAVILGKSYIDKTTTKELIAPMTKKIVDNHESMRLVVVNLMCLGEVMASIAGNTPAAKYAEEALDAIVVSNAIIKSAEVKQAFAFVFKALRDKAKGRSDNIAHKASGNKALSKLLA